MKILRITVVLNIFNIEKIYTDVYTLMSLFLLTCIHFIVYGLYINKTVKTDILEDIKYKF